MTITHTTIEDLDTIRELFGLAIQYQQSKAANHWHGMDEALIKREIGEHLHWKIVEEGIVEEKMMREKMMREKRMVAGRGRVREQALPAIVCFFSVAFADSLVWDERDADPSLYLHRIITNPAFRGRGYVKHIIAWAESFGAAAGKRYIRLDTHVDNQRLNAYYQECGFVFCGVKKFDGQEGNPGVPRHYLGSGLSLYEREIPIDAFVQDVSGSFKMTPNADS
ncbi:MAG: GNAT family N-acetyltransferase [Puia sp.]|nr:GNAT family N-acetyltransferase [Puia sp.]